MVGVNPFLTSSSYNPAGGVAGSSGLIALDLSSSVVSHSRWFISRIFKLPLSDGKQLATTALPTNRPVWGEGNGVRGDYSREVSVMST
jgi:hypothetical protein